ncbi:Uncharacterised protein [Sphingobacterium spiritivorum]|uniref:Uncharacterized protein n=1 Tax=Sphingobacterium spiritivorum TaxID=258 RepID=A0A380CVP7_SPHSI|nr:Uncharacterised protein [Sphingobacterium spiritivorum]
MNNGLRGIDATFGLKYCLRELMDIKGRKKIAEIRDVLYDCFYVILHY